MSTNDTNQKCEKFTIIWRIENFLFLPQENGNCLTSPTFNIKTFKNTKWNLQLFPKGYSKADSGFISCFLQREADDGPDEIVIKMQLSINSIAFCGLGKYQKGEIRGYQQIVSLNQVKEFPDNYFIIEARLHLTQGNGNTNEQPILTLLPFTLKIDSLNNEISQKLYSEAINRLKKMEEDICINPTHCFVNTRVLIEKRTVVYSLDDFFKSGNIKSEKHINIISYSLIPSLLITLYKKESDDFFQIDISLASDLEEQMTLSCKVNLQYANDEIYKSFEDIHIFEAYENGTWTTGDPIQLCDLQNKSISSLRFDFIFSNGAIVSNIEWTPHPNSSSFQDANIMPSNIAKELHQFCTEEKFCDVTLQTKDRNFKAHKAILCAASPVFAAMFESGMKESETGMINIDDLDSNTVSKLLNFIYTEDMQEWDFDLVSRMYSAADKYALENLKLKCKYYLKGTLNIDNVLDILFLAEAHNDKLLKESIINFLFIHKNKILLSSKWKELTSKNSMLTNEILLALCLK